MKKVFFILLGLYSVCQIQVRAQNVGIGTSSPARPLHIHSNNFVFPSILFTNNGTGATSTDGLILGMQFQADAPGNRYGYLMVQENNRLIIGTNDIERIRITENGFVGIGITDPSLALEVDGTVRLRGSGALEKRIVFRNNAGTDDMGSIGHLDDNVISIAKNSTAGQFSKFYFDVENEKLGIGAIPGAADGKILVNYNSSTGNPHLTVKESALGDYARLEFANNGAERVWHIAGQTVAGAGITNRANDILNIWNSSRGDIMSFRGDGRVGILTTNPANGYALSVDGKIICEELRVQLSGAWPDYVFQDQYQLPSLQIVENYIRTNKHLPGIPAATQIEKEGLDMGDMQKRMMEKIEELTLYIIQQQKEIDLLKKQMHPNN